MFITFCYFYALTCVKKEKPCQRSKMKRHIENPGRVRTAYSGIFKHIQWHSAIFGHNQAYWATLKAYLGIFRHFEPYTDIFRTLFNHCIYNHATFKPLAQYRTQGIFKNLPNVQDYQAYWELWQSQNSLYKHFEGYLEILMQIQPHSQACN